MIEIKRVIECVIYLGKQTIAYKQYITVYLTSYSEQMEKSADPDVYAQMHRLNWIDSFRKCLKYFSLEYDSYAFGPPHDPKQCRCGIEMINAVTLKTVIPMSIKYLLNIIDGIKSMVAYYYREITF